MGRDGVWFNSPRSRRRSTRSANISGPFAGSTSLEFSAVLPKQLREQTQEVPVHHDEVRKLHSRGRGAHCEHGKKLVQPQQCPRQYDQDRKQGARRLAALERRRLVCTPDIQSSSATRKRSSYDTFKRASICQSIAPTPMAFTLPSIRAGCKARLELVICGFSR